MGSERKLSPKEIARKEKIEALVSEKEKEGYVKKDLTVSVLLANVLALFAALPFIAVFVLLFCMLFNISGKEIDIGLIDFVVFYLAFFLSIVVHELIHGLFWGIGASKHFKSIEFGVIWKMLTPYCTCLEPLSKGRYILGTAMPGVILGILPSIISLFTLNIGLLAFGCLSIMGAGGDILIVAKLLAHKSKSKDTIYLDHPYEMGLMILEKKI